MSRSPSRGRRRRICPTKRSLVTRTRAEAENIGEEVLKAQLAALLGKDGSVTSERVASAVQGDTLLVTLSAECEEQIGREVPIAIDEG